jgi:hypothetical protein
MATTTYEGLGDNRRVGVRRSGDRPMAREATDGAIRDDARSRLLRDTAAMRLSWPGVWGGVFIGIGVGFLLSALGVAVGISAVDPTDIEQKSLGLGASLWAIVSLLIALYVGGLASTRISAVLDRTVGAVQGALVWVLSVLVMTWLATAGIGLVASGAFKLLGGATQAVGTLVTGNGPDLSSGSVDQIVGRLKDPQTARTLAAATGMSEQDVSNTLAQIADKAQAARDNPAQAAAEVRQGVQGMIDRARSEGKTTEVAMRAKSAATKAAWITFLALLVTLGAAILGAITGRHALVAATRG